MKEINDADITDYILSELDAIIDDQYLDENTGH